MTQQTALALACYAIGLGGYSALKVLTPAFYALNDARTPMLVSLAPSSSTSAWPSPWSEPPPSATPAWRWPPRWSRCSVSALFWILRNRIGGIHGRALLASVTEIVFASAVMGMAVLLSSRGIEMWLGVSRFARLVDLAISIPVGLAAFYTICRLTRVAELEMAVGALLGPLSGWLSRRRAKL